MKTEKFVSADRLTKVIEHLRTLQTLDEEKNKDINDMYIRRSASVCNLPPFTDLCSRTLGLRFCVCVCIAATVCAPQAIDCSPEGSGKTWTHPEPSHRAYKISSGATSVNL
jgi:hypothetical protein